MKVSRTLRPFGRKHVVSKVEICQNWCVSRMQVDFLKSFDSRSAVVGGLFEDVKQKVLQITISGEPVSRSAEPDSPPILGSLGDCEAREILPC